MSDLIAACTQSPVNLVLTLCLGFIALYWSVVLLGAIDIESLDFDFDLDLDTDGAPAGSGWINGPVGEALRFFHVGAVPVLVLVTIMVTVLWAIGVLTWPLVGHWGLALQLLAFIPMWFAALFTTKLITLPLKKLFAQMDAETAAENNTQLVGRRCTVVSLTADLQRGQAEIATDGAPLKLNVRTRDGADALSKGDEAVIVAQDADQSIYYVQRF